MLWIPGIGFSQLQKDGRRIYTDWIWDQVPHKRHEIAQNGKFPYADMVKTWDVFLPKHVWIRWPPIDPQFPIQDGR